MLCSRKHFLTKYFLKYLENRNKQLAQFNYVYCRMYFYSRVHKDWFAAIDYRRAIFTVVSFGIMGMLICCKKKNGTHFQKYFACLYIMLYIMPRNVSWSQFFLTITQYDSYGVASLLHIIIQNNQVSRKNVSQQQ